MRLLATWLLALSVAGCVRADLPLPEDSLARATTCSAVRALELRHGGNEAVSFDGFTEILHFAMIAAAEDDVQVDPQRLLAVSSRAPAVLTELEGKAWPTLIEPCNAAFPQTQRDPPALPPDQYEAGLTCFGLADFLGRTAGDYPEAQRAATALAGPALAAAQPILRQRASDDAEAQRIASGYAARAFKAGRPAVQLEQCRRRFPVTG